MSAPLPTPPPSGYPDRRPDTRAGCLSMPRPCPFVSCRYHLALDVMRRTNATPSRTPSITLNLPEDPALWPADVHTCALDVADEGGLTLDAVAAHLGGLSRERVRQIETQALTKLAARGVVLDLGDDLGIDTAQPIQAIALDGTYAGTIRPPAKPKPPRREPDRDPPGDITAEAWNRRSTQILADLHETTRTAGVRQVDPASFDLASLEAEIEAKKIREGGVLSPKPVDFRPTKPPRNQRITQPENAARSIETRDSLKRIEQAIPAPPLPSPDPEPPSPPTHAHPHPPTPAPARPIEAMPRSSKGQLPDPLKRLKKQIAARLEDALAAKRLTKSDLAEILHATYPEATKTNAYNSLTVMGCGEAPAVLLVAQGRSRPGPQALRHLRRP